MEVGTTDTTGEVMVVIMAVVMVASMAVMEVVIMVAMAMATGKNIDLVIEPFKRLMSSFYLSEEVIMVAMEEVMATVDLVQVSSKTAPGRLDYSNYPIYFTNSY